MAPLFVGGLQRVVLVVVRVDGRLVGKDEDVAEARELLLHRCDVDVAEQDVLVFLLDELVAVRHDDFDDVLTARQHRRAVGTGSAHGAIRLEGVRVELQVRRLAGRRQRAGRTGLGDYARELVHAVVRRRLHPPAMPADRASSGLLFFNGQRQRTGIITSVNWSAGGVRSGWVRYISSAGALRIVRPSRGMNSPASQP